MEQPDDRALVGRILNGDEAACELFARRWRRPCFGVAYSIVRHVEDAQDITQESLLKAIIQMEQLKAPGAVGPWVRAIACNTALKHLARRKRRVTTVSIDAVAPMSAPEQGGPHDAESLARALAGLEELERAVVRLHAFDGLRHEEIARSLGISAGYSRLLLFQARRKLREALWPMGLCP